MNVFKRDHQELVIIVLRFAVGAVFLWFGVDKWIHPSAWYGWIPAWVDDRLPVSLDTFLWWNGAFEFVIGILMVSGRMLRGASVAAGLFLAGIAVTLGANEVTVRDAALTGCCLALFIHANAKAKRPTPANVVSAVCSLYVLYLFVYGVLYLRSGA
ncbi:MAG TPA: DoxX family membrane protein [Patescibacteria group bacterium]|nr:DoxX family membrane protein [Patescibacteria group bacterium]